MVCVDDLFFVGKVEACARGLGIPLEIVPSSSRPAPDAGRAGCLVDLDAEHAIPFVEALCKGGGSGPLIGFLSHVHRERAEAARMAGVRQILARSRLSEDLPGILQRLSRGEGEGS